jgi:hypothetical protein
MDDLKAFRQWGSSTPGHQKILKQPVLKSLLVCLVNMKWAFYLLYLSIGKKTRLAQLFSMLFRSSGAGLCKCCWTSACGGEKLGCPWRTSLSTQPWLLLGKSLLLLLLSLCLSLTLCSCPDSPCDLLLTRRTATGRMGENGCSGPMPLASQITNPATVAASTTRSTPSATCRTTASWLACLPARGWRTISRRARLLASAQVVAEGGRCNTPRPPGRSERDGEATGRRMREEMAVASFSAAKSWRCWLWDLVFSPGTSPPQLVRHHLPLLLLPTLEQTNLAWRCVTSWSVEKIVFAALRFDPVSRRLLY